VSREDDLFEDDPALRAAVRRALGNEAAPAALRRRVEAMLTTPAAAAATAASTRSPLRLRWPGWMGGSPYKTLAAAVIAFLAIGLMFYQVLNTFDLGRGRHTVPHIEFPLAVAQDMVKAHEKSARENLTPTAADTALATKLTQTEGFTVATLNNAAGWQFKGGEESAIGATKGAQLVYGNHDQVVSVFSVRGPDHCNGGNSDVYRGTIDGHPISGFVQGGVVYAVVASANAPNVHPALADLDPLLAQVQSCTSGGSCGAPQSATPTTSTTTAP
jgi:hypothetical protein